MSRWPDRWIVVENWHRFQPRRKRPSGPWIQCYLALLHKPEWTELAPEDQALLFNIWLAYAQSDGRLRTRDALHLTSRRRTPDALRMFVTRSLDRLVEAGFIRFSDDKPLLLSTTAVHARARENGKPPRSDFDRALAWMRNAGAIVPPERLPGVLAEDFRITDQDELERLLAEVER